MTGASARARERAETPINTSSTAKHAGNSEQCQLDTAACETAAHMTAAHGHVLRLSADLLRHLHKAHAPNLCPPQRCARTIV